MRSIESLNALKVEFQNRQVELDYRNWNLKEQLVFFRKVVYVGIAATLLFAIPDVLKIGWKIELFYSVLSRGLLSALVYGLLKYLEYKKDAKIFHNALFIVSIAITVNTSAVVIVMENHSIISALSEIIAIQVFYVILPQRFFRALSVALFASVILVAVHFIYGELDPSDANAIIMAYVLANLFGIIYNRNMNRYQRLQYGDLLYEQGLNERLDREIQQREKLQKKLLKMTRTDPLTKIFNRRYFVEQLELEIHEAGRYNSLFSLLTLDIDYFKKINDQYGHQEGDRVLLKFSQKIGSLLRKSDLLARVGGEEFVILASKTTKEAAFVLGEKIRKNVEKAKLSSHQKITVSIGIAEYIAGVDTTEMMGRSDQALYKAKEEGRNRVVVYEGQV